MVTSNLICNLPVSNSLQSSLHKKLGSNQQLSIGRKQYWFDSVGYHFKSETTGEWQETKQEQHVHRRIRENKGDLEEGCKR